MAKALVAAGLRPPAPRDIGHVALLSLADSDKPVLADLAGALAAAGYRFWATRGTARALEALGHSVETLARVDAAAGTNRSVLDAISSGEVALVVNTPSPESKTVADAGDIRRAALAEGVLCLTSIDTALAAAATLAPNVALGVTDVRSLDEWLAAEPVPA
jgi:carbamoyl-phosphate synthase large subunit